MPVGRATYRRFIVIIDVSTRRGLSVAEVFLGRRDFDVDDDDLALFDDNLGLSNPTLGDLDGDGLVDAADLDLMFAQYGA